MHVVLAVLAFGALIIIHELGHYFAARWSGMKVLRFSIGFGPVIFRRQRGDTEWAVSALPLGGYVSIAGMDPSDPDRAAEGSYATKPAWKRLVTIAAGPTMNYLFAFVLATAIFAVWGQDNPDRTSTMIANVQSGGPAQSAGVQAGDKLTAVDGQPVTNFDEIVAAIKDRPEAPLRLTLQRGDAATEVMVTPLRKGDRAVIGIEPPMMQVRMPPGQAIVAGAQYVWNQNAAILGSLAAMISGREKAQLSGPVGIAKVMTEQAKRGIVWLLRISAALSVALALFNFLPLPALDGGRLVFLGVELITRRPVNHRIEQAVHTVGFVLLLGLILLVSVGDVRALFAK